MIKRISAAAVACSTLFCLTGASFAAVVLPSNRNIDIEMSNDAGALYGTGTDDTYRIIANGGGLNQLHIANNGTPGGAFGQVTTQDVGASSSASGTFWITTTGGRGYNDDIILMFSLQGPIGDDFSLNVKSSGYQWTASTAGVVNPVYNAVALDETFTKDDFLYGPHTAKPGPGNGWTLPFYSGQNINDPATEQYLMFVDLNVGNTSNRSDTPTDSGSAKVEFDLSGIYGRASFNAYAWAFSANIGDASINWTNRLSTNLAEAGQSGWSITTTAVPVPEPEQALLLMVGLSAVFLVRRGQRARARRPSLG